MDYSIPGILKILMTRHIDKVIEEFPEMITRTSPTTHTENLFKVRDTDEADYLSKEMAQAFH